MYSPLIVRLVVAGALLTPLWQVHAEPVTGLFDAEVPIAAQDTAARDAAIRQGLADVFVKVSGTHATLDNPTVVEAVKSASQYLIQFSFDQAPIASPVAAPGPGAAPGGDAIDLRSTPEFVLHASFQPAAVTDILRRAAVPILPPSRPTTLVWLLFDDGSQRHLVNREMAAEISEALLRQAAHRGIPLLFPSLDLEDSVAVTPDQIDTFDMQSVTSASSRYGADTILLARMVKSSSGSWMGDWKLQLAEESPYGSLGAPGLDGVSAQLVDAVAEALAAHFAIVANPDQSRVVSVRVDGIGSFAAYKQIQAVFAGLASVRELRLTRVQGTSLSFDLQTDTAQSSLEQEISVIPQLVRDTASTELSFHWAGEPE